MVVKFGTGTGGDSPGGAPRVPASCSDPLPHGPDHRYGRQRHGCRGQRTQAQFRATLSITRIPTGAALSSATAFPSRYLRSTAVYLLQVRAHGATALAIDPPTGQGGGYDAERDRCPRRFGLNPQANKHVNVHLVVIGTHRAGSTASLCRARASGMAYSPDGRLLVARRANTMWLWSPLAGSWRTLEHVHRGNINRVIFSPTAGSWPRRARM